MTDRVQLAVHGTRDVELPPSALVSAAREDLARRERNKLAAQADREYRDSHGGNWPIRATYERFAFDRKHIKKAKAPADILKATLRALEDAKPNDPLPKLSVLHLTASLDNLKLAIALAEKEESHAESQ